MHIGQSKSSLVFSCGKNFSIGSDTFFSELEANRFMKEKKGEGYSVYLLTNHMFSTYIVFYKKKDND